MPAEQQQRKISAPAVNLETQHFWDAAADGKLLIKKCTACGEPHFYPRTHCPFCFSDKTEWVEASGKGTVYTYSVMRRAPIPYAIAYVTLAEGPTMTGRPPRLQAERRRPASADVHPGLTRKSVRKAVSHTRFQGQNQA